MLKTTLKKLKNSLANKIDLNGTYKKNSYSQCGEDLIIDSIFKELKIEKPSYLDLGAHHPKYLSNTYLFYKNGSRGVNVEPDPFLIKEFNKTRKNDINLNVGIGFSNNIESADFYLMTAKTLNTFSAEEAYKIQEYGTYKIEKTIQVPIVPVNKIIEENFNSNLPHFVSIDVEGLDYEIIKSFSFEKYRPYVFCIETLTYTEDKTEQKLTNIIDFLLLNGYFVYADTYINTIFVDKQRWLSR